MNIPSTFNLDIFWWIKNIGGPLDKKMENYLNIWYPQHFWKWGISRFLVAPPFTGTWFPPNIPMLKCTHSLLRWILDEILYGTLKWFMKKKSQKYFSKDSIILGTLLLAFLPKSEVFGKIYSNKSYNIKRGLSNGIRIEWNINYLCIFSKFNLPLFLMYLTNCRCC